MSLLEIICAVSFDLLGCPPKPPSPPIEALQHVAARSQAQAIAQQPVATRSQPRNLVLFLADGLGEDAVAVARAIAAMPSSAPPQPAGSPQPTEEIVPTAAKTSPARLDQHALASVDPASEPPLSSPARPQPLVLERFPASAISRTHAAGIPAADYAGSMSAILTGVSADTIAIGMQPGVAPGTCPPPGKPQTIDPASTKPDNQAAGTPSVRARPLRDHEVPTLLEQAKLAGLAAGIVTNSRITLAVPAATYAHVTDRNWEIDTRMPVSATEAGCRDIARQLVEFDRPAVPDARTGRLANAFARKASAKNRLALDLDGQSEPYSGLDVIMGGGRIAFLPQGAPDPVDPARKGVRKPVGQGGVDLILQWRARSPGSVFVTGARALQLNTGTVGPLLGLFAPDHMAFEADRQQQALDQPSLAVMTEAAIKRLSRGRVGTPHGYVLVIDAGGIDRAAIAGQADRLIGEIDALDAAVARAVELTAPGNDTMIVVAAGHADLPRNARLTPPGYVGEDIQVFALGPGADRIHGAINAIVLHRILLSAILHGHRPS